MSLPLPNLDNRTYAELLEEARSLIPSEYAKWTNHNPSDPGIILMEMLAWLTEMLLYRVDQVPDSNVEVFLKLLNGPDWQRTGDLDAAIRQTILELRQRYRAASCEDFQQLVLEDWHQTQAAQNLGADGQVARVKCLKERNLAASSPSARAETAPGHVSLVVLPQRPKPAAETPDSVLSFDGLSSYVDLANGISALIDNQITVEAWAYSNDLLQKSKYRAIASDKYPDGGKKIKFELYLNQADDKLSGGFYDRSWYSVSSDSGFPMKEWVHVAASYGGESIKLYQNGNLIQESNNLNRSLPTTGSGWRIGRRHASSKPSNLWNGKITEVRIWNRVRSADEIQADMHHRLTGNETGLVGYWPLNEGDGTIVLDKTANEKHGTIYGAAQWVTDSELQLEPPPPETTPEANYLMFQDSVLSFDGINDYVELPPASLPTGNQITVSFWTYGGNLLPKSNSVIETKDANNIRVVNIHLPWSNQKIYFDCGGNGGAYDRIENIAAATDYKGKWSHWAFTKNASTGEMKIYLNGEQWHSGSSKTRTLTQATRFRLGSYCDGGTNYHGKIAEVRIWNQARTQTEIAADMNRRLTGNETGLVGYWPLNDGNGSVVLDKTANQNHGTIHGAQWVRDSELQLAPPPYLMLQPTTALCQNLWIYLDERRLLTTRHHVVGPDYVIVQITATLHLQAGARPDAVRSQAVTSLKQFFDPLQGGTEGKGWPFGRDVYISEVYERLDSLPGVDYVENITLQGDASQRQVTLEDHQLVALDVDENSFTIN